MKREIHVWDLPLNEVYIKLNEEYNDNLFQKIYSKFRNWNHLGKILKIKRPDTSLARDWKKRFCSFPLKIALKMCDLTNSSRKELEKNICEIRYKKKLNDKGGNSGKPIKNPRFPIKIDEDFVAIIGHICGDGSMPICRSRSNISFCYINSEIKLINNFKRLVRSVFGGCDPNVIIRDDPNYYTKPNYYLRYPTIFSVIVLTVFKGKQDPLEFPNYLLNSKKKKHSFLRAIYDDEGYVNDRSIILRMKSREFVEGCKNILNDLGINTGILRKINNRQMHYLSIAQHSSIKLFNKNINLIHPMKKERISLIACKKLKFKRYRNFTIRNKILDILKCKESNIKEISLVLNRNYSTIRGHILNLEKEKLLHRENNVIKLN